MIDLLKKFLDFLIEFFKYKEIKNNNRIIENKKIDEFSEEIDDKIADKIDEVNKAIDKQDTEKINTIINRSILILLFLVLSNGCITKYVPIYVQEDAKVIYEEKEGRAGYWVPQETMRKLLSYKIKWEAYLEAKQDAD